MLFFLPVVRQIGITNAEKSSLARNSTNFNVQSSQENVSCNNTGNKTPEVSIINHTVPYTNGPARWNLSLSKCLA